MFLLWSEHNVNAKQISRLVFTVLKFCNLCYFPPTSLQALVTTVLLFGSVDLTVLDSLEWRAQTVLFFYVCLFHLAYYLPCPSMLSKIVMTPFFPFSEGWIIFGFLYICVCVYVCVCMYIYIFFFTHCSSNGHLTCFHTLAIVNYNEYGNTAISSKSWVPFP